MIRTLLVAACLFFFGNASAQKLYSLRYANEDSLAYECFMVYFSPTNCYMRIRYKNDDSTGTYNVMQVTYNSVTGKTKDGEPYLCLKADPHPIRVMGDTNTTDNFIPDSYIWFTKETGKKRGPYITRDMIDFTIIGAAPQYLQLNPRKLTEEDLLEFYESDEASLKALKEMCGIVESSERYQPPIKFIPTIHLIMAANTLDPKIGVSCKKDLENMTAEFDSIASWLGLGFRSYLVYGNNFNRQALLSKLNQVKPDKEDVVIFSYSGHGWRWEDQRDSLPFMNLWVREPYDTNPRPPRDQAEYELMKKKIHDAIKDNSMTMSEVYDIIAKKNARLRIVLGDLCNTSNKQPKQASDEISEFDFTRGIADPFKIPNLQKLGKLFVQTKGNMMAVATKPEEKAGGDNTRGGYFTSCLIDALEYESSYISQSLSWKNIVDQAIKNALVFKLKSKDKTPQSGIRYLKIME